MAPGRGGSVSLSGRQLLIGFIGGTLISRMFCVRPQAAAAISEQERHKAASALQVHRNASRPARPSDHFCHSRDFKPDRGRRASCMFRNICILPKDGIGPENWKENGPPAIEWAFIVRDGDELAPQIKEEDIDFTLGVGPHSSDNRLHMRPRLVTASELDAMHPPQTRSFVPDLSVLLYEYNNENFGHALMDITLPVYSILEAFGYEEAAFNVFRYSFPQGVGFSCDFQAFIGRGGTKTHAICAKFYKMLSAMLGLAPVSAEQESERDNGHYFSSASINVLNATQLEPTCFDTLLVGMSQYSDDCMEGSHGKRNNTWSNCMTGRQKQLWDFRRWVMGNVGAVSIAPNKHTIVVTRNNTSRGLRNIQELVDSMRSSLSPQIEIVQVDWPKLSIREQIEAISRATIFVTPPGGVSYISAFLPRWATAIRLYSSDFGLDWHVMNYLGYIHAEYVDCAGGKIDIADVMHRIGRSIERYEASRTNAAEIDSLPFEYLRISHSNQSTAIK